MFGKAVEKGQVSSAATCLVAQGASGEDRQPTPKGGVIREDFDVTNNADKGRLQRFAAGLFITRSDYEQIAPQTRIIGIVKSAVSHLIALLHQAGECCHVERFG